MPELLLPCESHGMSCSRGRRQRTGHRPVSRICLRPVGPLELQVNVADNSTDPKEGAFPMSHKSFFSGLLGIAAAALLALQFTGAPAKADDDDFLKAIVGVGALALIANEARKERLRKEAAARSARNAIEREINQTRVCRSGHWTGNSWVEQADGKPCLPTPKVCLRERWRGEFVVKYFDSGCMKQEGFRLSRRY